MNITKGLFRLWVFGSIIYVICILVTCFPSSEPDKTLVYDDPSKPPPGYVLDDNGLSILDAATAAPSGHAQKDDVDKAIDSMIQKEVRQSAETDPYSNLIPKAPPPPRNYYFELWLRFIALCSFPPLLILAFGRGLIWVVRGFRPAPLSSK